METDSESKVIQLADYQRDAGKELPEGWLELRPLKGPWALCSYAQLRKVLFNGPKPTRIDLIFSYERVTVKGVNSVPAGPAVPGSGSGKFLPIVF